VRRRAAGIVSLLTCVICAWSPVTRAQTAPVDIRMKAAFLGKMLSFMEWPATPEGGKTGPFQFCVTGEDSLSFALSLALRAKKVGERRVEVRWARNEKELKGCQVVFIESAGSRRGKRVLEAAKEAGILTIGEEEGFLAAGGAIQMSFEHEEVQFEVDLAATRSAGVQIDARLLSMAKRVVNGKQISGG
jgi:hypothetical protein